MDATRKPVTRYAARIMWGTSYGTAGLKITLSGSTDVTVPVVGENPWGWFIQELTATTANAPPRPVITIGTPVQKCVHGDSRFGGHGALRAAYLLILTSHVVLSATVIPLALTAFWSAFRGAFARHKRVTRVLLPIWLYVSVTGVVVYWMLYQLRR